MAKNLKPYEVPLDPDLAREILNIPVDEDEGDPPRTIGDRVERAVAAVDEANRILSESSLAAIVADTVMRRIKKRGTPSICVLSDGTVVLRVAYDEERPAPVPSPVMRSTKPTDLPTMAELRERADAVGVDISDLGRQRRAILERVRSAEESVMEDDPAPPDRLVDEVGEGPPPSAEGPRVVRRKKDGKRPRKGASGSNGTPTAGTEVPASEDEDLEIDKLLNDVSG